MNTFFDKITASTALEGRIREPARSEGEENVLPLWDVQASSFEVFAVNEPPSYRLKDRGSVDPEEITFRVRGIMCQKRLPPIYQARNTLTLGYLRQTVQLVTFMPNSHFGDYFAKINDLTHLFNTSVGGQVLPPATQKYEGHASLVISNPYFTSRSLTPTMESMALGTSVDPTGFLSRNQPQNFHHTMDNEVVYLKEIADAQSVRFQVLPPDQFENGDIVEAQFSFVAFPVAKNKQEFQLRMCLRALILIDDSFRRASMMVNTNYPEAVVPVFTLKRKVTYSFRDENGMEDSNGGLRQGSKRICIEE
ncbi:hypothetical protein CVT26_000324 [Gymnopilus dilepis]|uniref:Uncharacterized protein n=1 Tax=Gymnopilus dilepis TaxID=231916 RepID=A0A409VHH2_9AGAR|nr:hypothetical protein CVT26_000324 [Gymnopilus dilepis]